MTGVLRNIALVYWSPTRLYRRLEDSGQYGVALTILLLLLALCGYALAASGLIDREVGETSERAVAAWDASSRGEISRQQSREGIASLREEAVFWKLVSGGWAVISRPAAAVGRVFVAAGVLFVLAALAGRTPRYGNLVTVFVYASYSLVIRETLRVGMMLQGASTDVDTSLAVVLRGRETVSGPAYLALQAMDPFVLWFWGLAVAGVVTTRQLQLGRTVAACVVLWAAEGLAQGAVMAGLDQLSRAIEE